jgi:hypothetical protein
MLHYENINPFNLHFTWANWGGTDICVTGIVFRKVSLPLTSESSSSGRSLLLLDHEHNWITIPLKVESYLPHSTALYSLYIPLIFCISWAINESCTRLLGEDAGEKIIFTSRRNEILSVCFIHFWSDLNKIRYIIYSGQSGGRVQVGARFSAPVQTGPGAHPIFHIMGNKSLSQT